MPDLTQFQLLLATFAAWVNRERANVIDYLREENRRIGTGIGQPVCPGHAETSSEPTT